MQNPYLALYDMMGKATSIPSLFFIGIVKKKLPSLVISLNDIDLDNDDFLIASSVLTLNNASITVPNETITHNLEDVLNIGDKVLLVKAEGTFILLCKVVSA